MKKINKLCLYIYILARYKQIKFTSARSASKHPNDHRRAISCKKGILTLEEKTQAFTPTINGSNSVIPGKFDTTSQDPQFISYFREGHIKFDSNETTLYDHVIGRHITSMGNLIEQHPKSTKAIGAILLVFLSAILGCFFK